MLLLIVFLIINLLRILSSILFLTIVAKDMKLNKRKYYMILTSFLHFL